MRKRRRHSAWISWTLLGVLLLGATGFFHPPRSDQAAESSALLTMGAPAPQNPSAPFGVGATAVGLATLAASRRK